MQTIKATLATVEHIFHEYGRKKGSQRGPAFVPWRSDTSTHGHQLCRDCRTKLKHGLCFTTGFSSKREHKTWYTHATVAIDTTTCTSGNR